MFKLVRKWFTEAQADEESSQRCGAGSRERSLAHYRQGLAHFKRGEDISAGSCFSQAIAIRSDFGHAYFYLGLLARKEGRFQVAAERLRVATELNPEFATAWLYLGVTALDTGNFEEAERGFKTALTVRPGYAQAHSGLGKMAEMRKDFVGAAAHFKQAIALDPEFAIPYNNLAHVTLREFFDAEAALEYVHKALALEPNLAAAHNNLAMILQFQGRCEESLAACARALELDPGSSSTLMIRALAQLMLGRFEQGWLDYEARKNKLRSFTVRKFPHPEWDGSELSGRNILVYHEQGIGDEIMFASCFPDLLHRGGHCVIECSAKLERLFVRSFSQATIQVADQAEPDMSYLKALPDFDYQIAAGSLPLFFRRSPEDFPEHRGYLAADAKRVAYWDGRLQDLGTGLKVGVSWRGGRYYTNQAGRSIDIEELVPVLEIPGVHFISLQYGDCGKDLERLRGQHGISLPHWQEAIDDYDETAALVSALDLIVSVQTAVVHLGGGLGKRVFVMVPSTPEWRYMAQGDRMPWYPSVRLFRQSVPRLWGPVIDAVVDAIRRAADAS